MMSGFYDALISEFPSLAQTLENNSCLVRAFEWAFNQGHALGREDGQADMDLSRSITKRHLQG